MINRLLSLLFLLLVNVAHTQEASTRDRLLQQLETQFTKQIARPKQYQLKAQTECGTFPEGNIFPYTLAAIGYCHLIYESPERKDELLPAIESLLNLGDESLRTHLLVKDLAAIKDYQSQGTLLGNFAMALSAYRLAGGTAPKLVSIEKNLVRLFIQTLIELKGRPVYSYPNLCWPFDTAPVLLAIELNDRVEGSKHAPELIVAHFEWINKNGLDKVSQLPASQVMPNDKLEVARGCDLSWRLALYSELDSKQSADYYRRYIEGFWIATFLSQGLKEWADKSIISADLDSGPIIGGVGSTATVLGLAATQSNADNEKSDILIKQAQLLAGARKSDDWGSRMLVQTMDQALAQSGIVSGPNYVTGFLFGDVTTFYALSWTGYPRKVIGK